MDDRQAKASALFERAAERLENAIEVVGGNPAPFVFDDHQHVAANVVGTIVLHRQTQPS